MEEPARAIATPKLDFLRSRREDIVHVAEKHGARNVRIFGSVARGEAGPDSDVDFLVDLEDGRSLLDLAGLACDLEDLLCFHIDVATEKSLKERIRGRVIDEAVRL